MGRVLIVDDEETYRTQLSLIVTSKGHEVQSTVDGQEAISIGSVFLPDLLVTDWRLKHDMTGLQVAEALRKAKPRLADHRDHGLFGGGCHGRNRCRFHQDSRKTFHSR